jgi:hypothetical protein
MVVFPTTADNGSGSFGVAKITAKVSDTEWDGVWYSNKDEDPLGDYLPCWVKSNGSWYSAAQPRHRAHKPMLLSEWYRWPIVSDRCADVGFKLQGKRLPEIVLRRIEQHKAFHWVHPDRQ